jgi:O-antigen/teichoic acid export membrane protein
MKAATVLGTVLFVTLFLFQEYVASLLDISVSSFVPLVGCATLCALLSAVPSGLLQGLRRFKLLALTTVAYPVVRLIVGVLLVAFGFGLVSGLVGTISGIAIALGIGMVPFFVFRSHFSSSVDENQPSSAALVSIDSHLVFSVLTALCLAVPTAMDVILVKHFFSAYQAGLYSTAATLGKILIFIPTIISLIMVPIIANRYARGWPIKRFLVACALGSAAVATAFAVFFFIFAQSLLMLLYGQDFLRALELVQWYNLAIIPFCFIFVVAQYSLAVDKIRYTFVLLGYVIVVFGAIVLYHNTLMTVIISIGVVNLIFAVGSGLFLLLPQRDRLFEERSSEYAIHEELEVR